MNNFKVLLYALAGLVVGVGIGVLMAPSEGRITRERLRSSASNLRKRMGLAGEEEFSDSELEMDAITGGQIGF